MIKVSIPYSSGQCFFKTHCSRLLSMLAKFQSLIHQVSVSFPRKYFDITFDSLSFNPLFIRSVFLLDEFPLQIPPDGGKVSIPYSSGQCFFSNGLLRQSEHSMFRFQSLIHQVSVSFAETPAADRAAGPPGFNPLFIRSVFLFYTILFREEGIWHSFNPLFIRSVFLLLLLSTNRTF